MLNSFSLFRLTNNNQSEGDTASEAFWAPLAWCTWAHQYVYASLSGWNCSTVPCCTLHPSLCDCLKTSSSFCCQSSVCCAVLPLEFIRTSGFLCRRPHDMKETHCWDICVILFTPYLFLDDYLRHFSFQSTNVCSALEAFGVDALYKFTFYSLYVLHIRLPELHLYKNHR